MEKIKGFEDYGITSCGRVWNFKRGKFLKPNKNKYGYYQVVLYKNGIRYPKKLHRLVAEAYVPNPENLETVDHVDENKEHNYVKNLQWMTRGDNIVKSKAYKIMCIETGEIFESTMEAWRKTKIPYSNICQVLRKKLKSAGGFTWRRVMGDTLK